MGNFFDENLESGGLNVWECEVGANLAWKDCYTPLYKNLEYSVGGRGGVQKYQDRREEEVREHGWRPEHVGCVQ